MSPLTYIFIKKSDFFIFFFKKNFINKFYLVVRIIIIIVCLDMLLKHLGKKMRINLVKKNFLITEK